MPNLKELIKPEFFKTIFFGTKYLANYWFLGKTSPLICGLVLHNKCNLRCRHCRVVDRQTAPMTYEEATGVIDTFYARGGRCLYLEGGEPFLWKDGGHSMEDIVSYAWNKGYFAVIIYTNGTIPLESAASTVFVSVDGMKDTHDELRGKTFDKIIEHVRNSSHPSIYINYTINSVNKDDIEGFCRYIDMIPQIRGAFFYFHTPYYGYDELYLDTRQKNEVLEKLISLKASHKILNSKAGLRSAIRNDWKKNLGICSVYEEGTYYRCCRESGNEALCKDCGYLSYAEIERTLRLNPGAVMNALKYF
ncbi:MAG: radical SAM protein [Bacteroidales bacterium]|jgi:MoaA/NifB/PqqE/SkfB family radical SAM enzyme|nr:radical SAM protein [Bacteroidales bacterium]